MKDNLKTFPCGQTPSCNTNDKGERIYCHKCTKPEEWKQRIKKELREKYRKLCKTRIQNIADDAVAFFIEELTDLEPEEILGET